MEINGYLRCRLTKNSPRRTTSTPAGVFCTLLASTPFICKKVGYIWQTVNLPRLFQKRIVLKNSPRRIKSGTDADGSKQKRVYFTLPASTPPISKKAYFKKTNKNTYCKKHSIQVFYKQTTISYNTYRPKKKIFRSVWFLYRHVLSDWYPSIPKTQSPKADRMSARINLKTNYSNHAQRQPVSKIPAFCPWAFFIYSDVEKPIKAFQLTPTSPNILFRKMGFLGAKPISRTFLFSGL